MSTAPLSSAQLTRHLFQHFSQVRSAFLAQIQGLESAEECQQYASLLLQRLLFVFFLQQRGLLAGDSHYLSTRLQLLRDVSGPERFFRHFLLRFFYEGLNTRTPTEEQAALFGPLPYLASTLFLPHSAEHAALQIPDNAFSTLFAFFESYQFCLEEQTEASPQTITPALLGHIFELAINQQEFGAYYTPEDVTEYIARNTLIPYLFSAVARARPADFGSASPIWQRLHSSPERYISSTLSSATPLAYENAEEYALRQERYHKMLEQIRAGNITTIDECVTLNLDIQRFAEETLRELDSVELLAAFYRELKNTRVLDPTCGSGAFLFGAMKILVPLYQACLERIAELAQSCPKTQHLFPPETLATWSNAHSCACETTQSGIEYLALHMVVTRNLYGVDLMAEATEICRLRLSLALLACMPATALHVLPDLAPQIRTGNALVGFTRHPGAQSRSTLDHLLAQRYGVAEEDEAAFLAWQSSHRPFHWDYEFPEVMAQGGFAVIIGNPPYVEYNRRFSPYTLLDFETLSCGNLYPCVIERSYQILSPTGRHGMILPLAAFSTRAMQPLISSFRTWFPGSWLSFYHFRPSMLFSGSKLASIPTLIFLARADGPEQRFSTHLFKWHQEERSQLFPLLSYCEVTAPHDPINPHYYPKLGEPHENTLLEKLSQHPPIRQYLSAQPTSNTMFYRSAGGLYWKVFVNFPWPYQTTSNKSCSFLPGYERDLFVALFNSSLFWWYYTVTFDTFNVKDYMLFGFRFTYPDDPTVIAHLIQLCRMLMQDLRKNARHLKRGRTDSYTLYVRRSKPILDEIDAVLASLYGFSSAEAAFIRNYDIKYRLSSPSTPSEWKT